MNQYDMPPTCFFSAPFARLSESTLGTANLLKDNRVGTAYVVVLLLCLLYQLALSKMKHSSVMCSLHTRTLSLFGGSSSHSVLNQVSLRLWSIGNVNKLNHFLSASLLEQSHVILYTIVSRIHPKNMPHVWEMKPLCATGFIARDVIDRRVPCQSAHELQ